MNDLATCFEQLRPRLLRVAYGTLGSLSEAEDVVQEAWLRLQRANSAEIEDLHAWLTTVVARLSLDALKAARRQREDYVGQWLPEPIVDDLGERQDERATLDESVATALLVVLERLSPAERTAYLLHDVFGMPFEQVASVVGRSPAAVRQLAARARRHVEAGRPRFPAPPEEHERVARALLALERKRQRVGHEMRGAPGMVNGRLGFVYYEGSNLNVLSLTVEAGKIIALDVVRNPDKLRHVRLPEQ